MERAKGFPMTLRLKSSQRHVNQPCGPQKEVDGKRSSV